jgi:membrane-associated phospholipid phosphatase
MGKAAGRIGRIASFDAAITAPLALPEKRKVPRVLALLIAHSGDSPVWAAVFAAVWLLGDPQWRAVVILAVVGMIAVEMVVIIVKMSVKRLRPAGSFGAIYRKTDPYSFPSGHAARAAMLIILSGLYCPTLVFAGILLWSPVMLFSRIAIGIHYVLDIVAGLVLGAGLTFVVIEAAHFIAGRL